MISAGSVDTFCSKITLPASSTTHTDVAFTDIVQTNEMHHLIAPSSMIEVARPQSAIVRERGRALIIQA
jgi:hypothetical protein